MMGYDTGRAATRRGARVSGALVSAAGATLLTAVSVANAQAAVDLDRIKQVISDPRGMAAPGCVMGAFRDGEPLFYQASGAADVAAQKPLNENTLFYAASTSKQFTVLAAAKLVEQNKLRMEDDVRKWIPELPSYEKPITVQMLANHTAGIRDWLGLLKMAGSLDMGKADRKAGLNLVYKQKNTNFTPGSKFEYSNGGYLLLSEVVERAAGMPFHEFTQQALFGPMGMTSSYFIHGERPKGNNVAHGYVPVGDGFDVRDTYPLTGGSGGLITTIVDLGKYDRDVQVGHKVWTPTVAKIMLTPGRLNDGSEARFGQPYNQAYAGGLLVGVRNGRYLFSHAGGAEGFSVNYANLPDRHLGIAIVCNRRDLDAVEKTYGIIDVIEQTSLASEKKDKAAKDAPAPTFIAKPELNGSFVSDELSSTYKFTTAANATTVTISSPWADTKNPAAQLKLAAPKADATNEGAAGGQKYQLALNDGTGYSYDIIVDGDNNGFTLDTGRVHGMHFKRTGKR